MIQRSHKMDQIDLASYKSRLASEGSLKIRIVSDSMRPCLEVGDFVEVKPLNRDPRPFDLLVYLYKDKFYCHYVWKNQIEFNKTIITRSLKEPMQDEIPHHVGNILGIVTGRKIPSLTRAKIVLSNLISGTL